MDHITPLRSLKTQFYQPRKRQFGEFQDPLTIIPKGGKHKDNRLGLSVYYQLLEYLYNLKTIQN